MIEANIAALDPLDMDEYLRDLPGHNDLADVSSISKVTMHAVEVAEGLVTPSPEVAAACLRDFDFCAGSLRRHGQDPMQLVDGLEDAMIKMGAAAGSVPRATVSTFAAANPDQPRKRSFTGTPEEHLFTSTLKRTYRQLEVATAAMGAVDMRQADRTPLREGLKATASGMQIMIDSTIEVKRRISPQVFSNVIRPYFEPLKIGGKEYHAPNGGQLQLNPLEAMLFYGQDDDAQRQHFFADNYPYFTAAQRAAVDNFRDRNNGRSVLHCLTQESKEGSFDADSTGLLLEVARNIRKFRYPHLKVTEENFAIRSDGAVGSGSYTPDALRTLLDKTNGDMATLMQSIDAQSSR